MSSETEQTAYNNSAYLEGVAALVWRWRAEADAYDAASRRLMASTLRECADELAHSIPAALVAAAGRASV